MGGRTLGRYVFMFNGAVAMRAEWPSGGVTAGGVAGGPGTAHAPLRAVLRRRGTRHRRTRHHPSDLTMLLTHAEWPMVDQMDTGAGGGTRTVPTTIPARITATTRLSDHSTNRRRRLGHARHAVHIPTGQPPLQRTFTGRERERAFSGSSLCIAEQFERPAGARTNHGRVPGRVAWPWRVRCRRGYRVWRVGRSAPVTRALLKDCPEVRLVTRVTHGSP